MKKKTLPMVLESTVPCQLKTKPKRSRKLPRKDIIDADFASPHSSSMIDDLLLIRTPSQHDRIILSELWGDHSYKNGMNPSLPHVSVGKPKRSIAPSKTTTTTSVAAGNTKHFKTYKDKILETKKSDYLMDLSNITLIPSAPKQQHHHEQGAANVDYTNNGSDTIKASDEHIDKEILTLQNRLTEGNQFIDQEEPQPAITSNVPSEHAAPVQANLLSNNKDEDNLLSDKCNTDQKHLDNVQIKEVSDDLEEDHINHGIEQFNKAESGKECISNISATEKVTHINQAGPESGSPESLDSSVSNDPEKSCQEEGLGQSIPTTVDSLSAKTQMDNSQIQNTASTMDDDQHFDKDDLKTSTDTQVLDLISQELEVKIDMLPSNANDTCSAASNTFAEYREATVEGQANTHVAEPSLVDQKEDQNNTIIPSPPLAPNTPQEDSRLTTMDHLSNSFEEDNDGDGDDDWIELKDEVPQDNVYEKIFQLMSVPKPVSESQVTKVIEPSIQKFGRKRKRFVLLKNSGALDWVENGYADDEKNKRLGIKKKRKLHHKLQRPYITKKHIKSCWIVE
jgi:uncharacterized protein YidB (DUF937 family)